MASPKFNSKSPTIKRILKEASELTLSPSPDYHATPASDADLFDWHFTIRGPPGTPYTGGIYHGRILLPPTYPLRPPSFRFLTPSGRFEVNREICLSISGHHEETWQPAWGIRTALVALRAFMEGDAKGQLGGLEASKADRERLAGLSGAWKCSVCGTSNEEVLKECKEKVNEIEKAGGGQREKFDVELPLPLRMINISSAQEAMEINEAAARREGEDGGGGEEAELAEGFIASGPLPSIEASSSSTNTNSYPAARPAQTVPQPTGVIINSSLPSPPAVTAPARIANAYPQQHMQRISSDGVPIWVDRTIAGVVVCLVFMVLKIMLGV